MTKALATVAISLLAAGSAFAGGYLWRAHVDGAESSTAPSVVNTSIANATRPDFHFTDQRGVPHDIRDWDGQVLVVNFWATWCPPCLHEIPFFIEVQRAHAGRGLQIIGIALDESENVKRYALEVGLNYPTMHGDDRALTLVKTFGNTTGGLPFTAVVGRSGEILLRKAGPMTREELARIVADALE